MTNQLPAFSQPSAVAVWWSRFIALILLVFGLPLAVGGAWLISLGGSWYYLPAGLALVVTAWLLFRQDGRAIWIYLLTYGATVIWALWEVGLDGWAQVPRLVAPTVVLVLVLSTWKGMRNSRIDIVSSFAALGAGIAAGVLGLTVHDVAPAVAQDVTAPSAQTSDPEEPVEESDIGDASIITGDDAPESPAQPSFTEAEVGTDWPAYGGTNHAMRYSPLTQITKDNIGELEKIWEFRTAICPKMASPMGTKTPLSKLETGCSHVRV